MLTRRASKSRLVYSDQMISVTVHHCAQKHVVGLLSWQDLESAGVSVCVIAWVAFFFCTVRQGCTCAQKCAFGLNEVMND